MEKTTGKSISIGDAVYWVYCGDVIHGKIVLFDKFNVKIETEDGYQFGKVRKDDSLDMYDIGHSDIATTREEAIELVKKGMSLTRATMSAWIDSLENLENA